MTNRIVLVVSALAIASSIRPQIATSAGVNRDTEHWIGTWATAPQPSMPGAVQTFRNQTLRLIVHTSAGGQKARIRISNAFGDRPLAIGAAHVGRRTAGADIDPTSDRTVTFQGRASTIVPPRSMVVSDPTNLDVHPLSDLAISLFLPENTAATTTHILALQTSYVSGDTGDSTAEVKFPVARTISTWPFLTGVDVPASDRGAAIVAFGSSTTDGDGSTKDANRRWPDVLAERLQKDADGRQLGVLNEGIIGNRLLSDTDSPRQAGGPFAEALKRYGAALGPAGVTRFDRDVLEQPGVRYIVLALGINDILFPGSFIPATESVSAESVISGYRQLITRAHKKKIRVIGTTIPPVEHAVFTNPRIEFFTPEKERVRLAVNDWIRRSKEFDAVVDLDESVRDPDHPAQLLPSYDAGDHLHVNDAGNVAQGNAFPLALFQRR